MDQTADLRPQMESLSVHINLLGLNDDCLIAILRLLPVHDLDSIASTCIRLKAIARAAFKLRPMAKRSFNFPELQYNLGKYERSKLVRFKARRLLRNFGHLFHEIDCDMNGLGDHQYYQTIFEDVVRLCSNGELQKLCISHVQLTPEWIACGKSLFSNLKSLQLKDYANEAGANFVGAILPLCTRLEYLHLENYLIGPEHLAKNFPLLTVLSLKDYSDVNAPLTPAIGEFLLRHKLTITKLTVEKIDDFNTAVLEQMSALEELHLDLNTSNYVQLNTAGATPLRIKKLYINCYDDTISKLIDRLSDSLEQFTFSCPTDSLFMACLGKFHRLSTFKISYNDDIPQVLQHLNGSIGALVHLDIFLRSELIDTALISAIGQFRNLRTLIVRSRHCSVEDCDFSALQHLDNLTEFVYSGNDVEMNWLKYLGSAGTMKSVEICFYCTVDMPIEWLAALCRYPNLETLAIHGKNLNDDKLNAVHGLDALTELRLGVGYEGDTECVMWRGLLNLVERLTKLEKLRLNYTLENFPLDLEIFNLFVDVYRTRDTKLLMQLAVRTAADIPADMRDVGDDLCDFVELEWKADF